MVSKTETRLVAIEKALKEITGVKEHNEREWEINKLSYTIGDEYWWDHLSPEQVLEATRAMKSANAIMCARMGMELRFVTSMWGESHS